MYKASVNLGKINDDMHLKLGVMLKSDDEYKITSKKYDSKTISYYSYAGGEGLRINPVCYLTIDISKSASDKFDDWNPNTTVNLNGRAIFDLKYAIDKLLDNIAEIPDLYFIKDNILYIDKDKMESISQVIKVNNQSKYIRLLPTIIMDGDSIFESGRDLSRREAVAFMINSPDNFCILSFIDLKYLRDRLDKINLYEMAMQIILAHLGGNKLPDILSHTNPMQNIVITEKKQEYPEVTPLPKIIPANTIPNI